MMVAGYEVATRGVGVCERSERGLVAVTGADRAKWLNNLLTNEVKALRPGEGRYTFAVNVKGRILFDLNVLVRDDAVWLDADAGYVNAMREHLERYHIREDVTLTDRTAETARVAVLGPASATLTESLGVTGLASMEPLATAAAALGGVAVTVVRHDFAGVLGVEFMCEGAEDAALVRAVVTKLGQSLGIAEVSAETLEVLRIEAGIPRLGHDIDEMVLPAETRQGERAVSHTKGCYLGQEVVERMRSRDSLARQLVGLTFEGTVLPAAGAVLRVGEAEVGRVTSVCVSPAAESGIGLGYVRTAHAGAGTAVTVSGERAIAGVVTALPFRAA